MRTQPVAHDGVVVRAISGTHVVFLAFDLSTTEARQGCLGFAIKRRDHATGEEIWLDAMKTFKAVNPTPGPGVKVSTRLHPIQGFQWADYTAKPGQRYRYEVMACYGTPTALVQGASVAVEVRTETADGAVHEVHFNRGAIASQEYAKRFQNQKPSEIADGSAYRWLSRGLEEALIAFIERAAGPEFSLQAAIYEFQWESVLAAFKAAEDRGADVKIIYDAKARKDSPRERNEAEIEAAGLVDACIPRAAGTMMHNKFIVLLREGEPVAVWTGSTNITENGIFGHLNVGHVVNDVAVAARFSAYWQKLADDPSPGDLKAWMDEKEPLPAADDMPGVGVRVVFSPHRDVTLLTWFARLAAQGSRPIFITLAFGMNEAIREVYRTEDGVLRVALLEKPGNGKTMAADRAEILAIRKRPNVLMAIGRHIEANNFDRWLTELYGLNERTHVRWVHTKFLLIDPLGPDPLVITGSANFSQKSMDTNEENMLVIRGDLRVADIYFTEFLRIYAHHAFRESLRGVDPGDTWTPNYLATNDAWQVPYYATGTESCLRRVYYAGI